MKHLLVTVALLFGFSACDAEGTAQDVPDGGAKGFDAGTVKSDAQPVTSLQDALPGYTANGVFVNFGRNPCGDTLGTAAYSGWDPTTGKCYTTAPTVLTTSGVCATAPACGTYAPGALLIWNSAVSRFHYMSDPSGGNVCLPNNVPYTIPC